MSLNLIGCSIVVLAFIISATEATEYNVGDSFGWNIPTNETLYSEWASTKKFYVGDKLRKDSVTSVLAEEDSVVVFRWSGRHTVGDVSKDDYDNCNNAASAFGGSENGTVFRVNLITSGPRYFICTVANHCVRGQKFSIDVESPNSDAPTTQPTPHSAAPTHSFGILSAFLTSLAVSVYFFTRRTY